MGVVTSVLWVILPTTVAAVGAAGEVPNLLASTVMNGVVGDPIIGDIVPLDGVKVAVNVPAVMAIRTF